RRRTADARRRRAAPRRPGHTARLRVRAARPWRPASPRPGSWRPACGRAGHGPDVAVERRSRAPQALRRAARRAHRTARAGLLLQDQIGVLMNEALRRSVAHVRVADVAAPALDDATEHHLFGVLR